MEQRRAKTCGSKESRPTCRHWNRFAEQFFAVTRRSVNGPYTYWKSARPGSRSRESSTQLDRGATPPVKLFPVAFQVRLPDSNRSRVANRKVPGLRYGISPGRAVE